MARSISEIKKIMTDQFMADPNVREKYGLADDATFSSSFSPISIESIFFYIFAVCAWSIEKLIDTHKSEITTLVEQEMPHTLTWYQNKALAFRYGQALISGSDTYDDGTLMDAEIEKRQIIKRAACIEVDNSLYIKVATTQNGEVVPLSEEQLTAFASYIAEIKDAGVKANIITAQPDRLSLSLILRVDGSVIGSDGLSIATGEDVVRNTIEEYLGSLPFNGELILANLVDALQTVEGIKIPHVAQASVQQIEAGGYGDAQTFDISHIPYSGYYTLADLNMTINN